MKQVIVVRKDLQLKVGQVAAQAAHAAVAGIANHMDHPDVQEWLDKHFVKIVLECASEEELLALFYRARQAGLIAELMTENNLYGYREPIPTAIAIGPHKKELVNNITGKLPLYD